MKVKVCGVRDQSFAAEAVRFGVDYLGFIFEPASPRFILPGKAKMISSCIRRSCEASSARKPALVGVFVKQSVAEILDVMIKQILVRQHFLGDAEYTINIVLADYLQIL